jgi:hypothetical protein
MGAFYYDQSTISPVNIALTLYNPPIQIPASGGSFDFNVAFSNSSPSSQTFDTWIMVQLPDASWYGPVLGPQELTLSSGSVIDRDRTQSVPGNAPAGTYLYVAYLGDYPDIVWTEDQFDFEKLGAAEGDEAVNGWANWGEGLDQIVGFGESRKGLTTGLPSGFGLLGAYPNPFNPTTVLSFHLQDASRVNLTVYDLSGRKVTELVNGWRDAGVHEVTFDGSDLTSGIYVYHLETEEFNASGKMVLMK